MPYQQLKNRSIGKGATTEELQILLSFCKEKAYSQSLGRPCSYAKTAPRLEFRRLTLIYYICNLACDGFFTTDSRVVSQVDTVLKQALELIHPGFLQVRCKMQPTDAPKSVSHYPPCAYAAECQARCFHQQPKCAFVHFGGFHLLCRMAARGVPEVDMQLPQQIPPERTSSQDNFAGHLSKGSRSL